MPKKICPGQGCNNLIHKKEKRCSSCTTEKKSERGEYDKKYNRIKRNKVTAAFYSSMSWKRTREVILMKDKYLCLNCLDQSIIQSAVLVHHIIETSVTLDYALKEDNLISLCDLCHRDVHSNYNNDVTQELEKKRLTQLIATFRG